MSRARDRHTPDGLSAKQRAFALAYDGPGTGVQAAQTAGYSGTRGDLTGVSSRLLRHEGVRAALAARGIPLPPLEGTRGAPRKVDTRAGRPAAQAPASATIAGPPDPKLVERDEKRLAAAEAAQHALEREARAAVKTISAARRGKASNVQLRAATATLAAIARQALGVPNLRAQLVLDAREEGAQHLTRILHEQLPPDRYREVVQALRRGVAGEPPPNRIAGTEAAPASSQARRPPPPYQEAAELTSRVMRSEHRGPIVAALHRWHAETGFAWPTGEPAPWPPWLGRSGEYLPQAEREQPVEGDVDARAPATADEAAS